jgi:hypothetical protein
VPGVKVGQDEYHPVRDVSVPAEPRRWYCERENPGGRGPIAVLSSEWVFGGDALVFGTYPDVHALPQDLFAYEPGDVSLPVILFVTSPRQQETIPASLFGTDN